MTTSFEGPPNSTIDLTPASRCSADADHRERSAYDAAERAEGEISPMASFPTAKEAEK
jgi:hypothetical protein